MTQSLRRTLVAFIGLCAALGFAHAHAADPPPERAALKQRAEALGDSTAKVDALAELARLEWQTDPATALRHGEEGLRIAERLGYDRGRAASLNAIGVVHYLRGDYERARALLEQALASSGKAGEAIPMLEAALAEARRLEVPELEAEARLRLFVAFRASGRLAEAIDHLTAAMELRDGLVNASSQARIAEMQARFESERSEREIRVLQQDKEIQ